MYVTKHFDKSKTLILIGMVMDNNKGKSLFLSYLL